jgi:hypothetical protein
MELIQIAEFRPGQVFIGGIDITIDVLDDIEVPALLFG